VEAVGAAGEHFVRVALMADVPDQLVARVEVELGEQRQGELDPPSPAPRCPPVRVTESMMKRRTSSPRARSASSSSGLTSCGDWMALISGKSAANE
jgi:hypothetical protein